MVWLFCICLSTRFLVASERVFCLVGLLLCLQKVVVRVVCAEELNTLVLWITEGIDTDGIITLDVVVDHKVDVEEIRNDVGGHIRNLCVPNTISLIRMEASIEGLGITEIRNVLLSVVLEMVHRKVANGLVEVLILVFSDGKCAVEAISVILYGTETLLTLGKEDGNGTDRKGSTGKKGHFLRHGKERKKVGRKWL